MEHSNGLRIQVPFGNLVSFLTFLPTINPYHFLNYFLKKSRLDELGAANEKKAIRLKMKYLFADSVLERYSWRGTEKKKPFMQLKLINKTVFESVRHQFQKYRYDQYKAYIIEWLKHSRTRQRIVTYKYPNARKVQSVDDDDDDDDDGDDEDGRNGYDRGANDYNYGEE